MASPSETSAAAGVLDLLLRRAPTLGAGRLLCVDGPSGSGKTTLAADVAVLAPEARVLHMDDMYEGWGGLPTVSAQLGGILEPLATGEPGFYWRYDWNAGVFAETVTVDPVPLLIIEGVGSGSPVAAELATALVWVEAEQDVRKRRGLDRDGEAFAPFWDRWTLAEQAHFARHQTRARADLVVRT